MRVERKVEGDEREWRYLVGGVCDIATRKRVNYNYDLKVIDTRRERRGWLTLCLKVVVVGVVKVKVKKLS